MKDYFPCAKEIKSHQERENLHWEGSGGKYNLHCLKVPVHQGEKRGRKLARKRSQKSLPIYFWTSVSTKEFTKCKPSIGNPLKEFISGVYNRTFLLNMWTCENIFETFLTLESKYIISFEVLSKEMRSINRPHPSI